MDVTLPWLSSPALLAPSRSSLLCLLILPSPRCGRPPGLLPQASSPSSLGDDTQIYGSKRHRCAMTPRCNVPPVGHSAARSGCLVGICRPPKQQHPGRKVVGAVLPGWGHHGCIVCRNKKVITRPESQLILLSPCGGISKQSQGGTCPRCCLLRLDVCAFPSHSHLLC